MGVSVSPSLTLGINMSYLITKRTKVEEFEIHDARGNKTGEVGKDVKTFYDIQYKGETITLDDCDGEGLYAEEIAEAINVADEPRLDKLGIFRSDYDSELEPDNLILGVKLIQLEDAMYGNTLGVLNTEKLNRDIVTLSAILKRDFGCEIKPSLYLNPNLSY